jgi:hypothetical protein
MYTPEMSTAFHAIVAPKNFGVVVADNEDYLNLIVDPNEFLALDDEVRLEAVQYINDVKKALETAGAIVQIVREVIEDDAN